MRKDAPEGGSEAAGDRCHWCQEPFPELDDRRIHVSRLGAAAAFHRSCFEEFEAASTES